GHTVSSRLSLDELRLLDERRSVVRMRRGEYLRTAALSQLPPSIPAINREAWVELSRFGANLNQIARHLNEGQSPSDCAGLRDQIAACLRTLADVRRALIGVDR
ncbi:MAG: plasmid mobilization relaxosome protein MobC, partial [Armatimonadota bacterium]